MMTPKIRKSLIAMDIALQQERSINNFHDRVFFESLKLWGFGEPRKAAIFLSGSLFQRHIYILGSYIYIGFAGYYV